MTFESLFVPPVTLSSLWSRPKKSLLSHFFVALIFSGFSDLEARAPHHNVCPNYHSPRIFTN